MDDSSCEISHDEKSTLVVSVSLEPLVPVVVVGHRVRSLICDRINRRSALGPLLSPPLLFQTPSPALGWRIGSDTPGGLDTADAGRRNLEFEILARLTNL